MYNDIHLVNKNTKLISLHYLFIPIYTATCWAIPLVRALQAPLNIGVCSQQQVELSIQHIINNVKFCSSKGISNIKTALHFIKSSGVCVESQCRHRGEFVKRKCAHQEVSSLYIFRCINY